MAPKPNQEPEQGGESIPPAIIAQAEAAINGNAQNRRPGVTRSKSDYTRSQDNDQAAGGGDVPLTKYRTHIGVPGILAADGTEAPPAYGAQHDQIELSQDGFDTNAKVTDDGRININIKQKDKRLSDLLVPALRNQLSLVAQEQKRPLPPGYIPPALGGQPGQTPPPKLNVVIHVVGSRGDVQPFVALGKVLKSTYGHRVRVATHPTFQSFVEENGLEFFSIGGDPSELMAFMVKNPGLMPGFDSLKSGDVGKRRKGMEEIVLGCWRSCIEAGDGLGAPPPINDDDRRSFNAGIDMNSNQTGRSFIADAIIANPPSFAHIHIAEKMGIPLHMMFTMPWSPTQSFPHPLANIQSSNADVNMTNFVSYALVEMMTWQGLGDVINRFRERALGLDPISLIWAPGVLSRLRIPYTYCWSPALIPKPNDWGQHISISGFYFLSLASSFTPAPDLAEYLAAGPPPVYIGFGSIVVDDPDAMTQLIFEAVKKSGVRALVSKGWGGLGADDMDIPEGVFMLGNVPHDWLFQHVSCVVHHGGAGTTAAGIATGKPTIVVPFFGDQPFWGAMVARAGAGPLPIPYKQLTADKLATAITEALKPETLEKAKELGARIKEEEGCEQGGKSFHDMLDVDNLRCCLAPSRVAVWQDERTKARLSPLAAAVLADQGFIDFADLKLYRPREYETEDGPWDPISGGASALLGTVASFTMGVADFPIEIFRAVKSKQQQSQGAESKESVGLASGSGSPLASGSQSGQPQPSLEDATELHHNEATESSSQPDVSAPSTISSHPSAILSFHDAASSETPPSSPPSQGRPRGRSLKEALRATHSRSGSSSKSGSQSPSKRSRAGSNRLSFGGTPEEFDPSKLTLENAIGASKGVSRIVGSGLKSPLDFTLGVARGFHNAPKLYGDDTVRPQAKVTGFKSGIMAAGKGFGYGFYDGISGLITQPIRGAEKEGTHGLIKGIGKGIGGLIMKPGAGIWGLPGYTFLGIQKEIRKLFGSSVANYVISTRTIQGYEDFKASTAGERLDIITRWRKHQLNHHKSSHVHTEPQSDSHEADHRFPKGFFQTRHLSFDERKKLHEERKARREAERTKIQSQDGQQSCPYCRRDQPHTHTPHHDLPIPTISEPLSENATDEFERAVHTSVTATSRGDPDEDLVIERAIRASIRELQKDSSTILSNQEALNRAIQASIAEASRNSTEEPAPGGDDAAHQKLLQKSIQDSLASYQITARTRNPGERGDADGDDLKKAIQMSQGTSAETHNDSDEDEDVKLAIRSSKEEYEKANAEEEIVLQYIKKQSLAAEVLRSQAADNQRQNQGYESKEKWKEADDPGGESTADEEALMLAIQESLKGTGGGEASGSGS